MVVWLVLAKQRSHTKSSPPCPQFACAVNAVTQSTEYEQSIARRDAKMMLISQPLGPSASASCALHLAHTSFPPLNPLLSRTVNRLSKSATFERVGIGRADTA